MRPVFKRSLSAKALSCLISLPLLTITMFPFEFLSRLYKLLPAYADTTVIRFSVRVPVLSEHITVAQPRVSTAGSLLINAFLCTIRRTPIAKAIVTTAGSPSGTAATAKLIPPKSICTTGSPLKMPIRATIAHIIRQKVTIISPSFSSLFCKGVSWVPADTIISAILPISVSIPVAITTAFPLPFVTRLPMYNMLPLVIPFCLWFLLLISFFETGTDSPVSIDSSKNRELPSIITQSAGTRSPASMTIKSLGTTISAGISLINPSRITLAWGAAIFMRASIAFSVRISWKKPSSPLRIRITRIAIPSLFSPIKNDMTDDTMRIIIIKSVNWDNNVFSHDFFLPCFKMFLP